MVWVHVPLMPQVSTALPEHSTAPRLQTPTQLPATHVMLVHAMGVPHMPPAQVCTALPEHCTLPFVQVPEHTPLPVHIPELQGVLEPH